VQVKTIVDGLIKKNDRARLFFMILSVSIDSIV